MKTFNSLLTTGSLVGALLLPSMTFASVITLTEDDLAPAAFAETVMTGVVGPTAPLGNGALMVNGDGYVEEWLYWNPAGDEYLLQDIESLSFSTKSDVDNKFFFQIYTAKDGIHEPANAWFGQRITFDTANVFFNDEQSGQWTTWTTNRSANWLMASDTQFNDFSPSGLTYTDLVNSLVPGGDYYGNERIIGWKIGTSTTSPDFVGAIDNLTINFRDSVIQYDFEPNAVPEPESIAMFALGILMMGLRRSKRS